MPVPILPATTGHTFSYRDQSVPPAKTPDQQTPRFAATLARTMPPRTKAAQHHPAISLIYHSCIGSPLEAVDAIQFMANAPERLSARA